MNNQLIKIQNITRKYVYYKRYKSILYKIILIQSYFRKQIYFIKYLKKKKNINLIQITFRKYNLKKKSLVKSCLKTIKKNIINYKFNFLDINLLNDCKIFYDDGIGFFNDLKFIDDYYQKILIIKIVCFFINRAKKHDYYDFFPDIIKKIIILSPHLYNKKFNFINYTRLDRILLKHQYYFINKKYNRYFNNIYLDKIKKYNINRYLNNIYFDKIKQEISNIEIKDNKNSIYNQMKELFYILKIVINFNYKKMYSLIKIQRWWIYNIKINILLKYRNFNILKIIKKIQSFVRKIIIKYYFDYYKIIKKNFPFKVKEFKNQSIKDLKINVLWWKKNTNRNELAFYHGKIIDQDKEKVFIHYDDNESRNYDLHRKTSLILENEKIIYLTNQNMMINNNSNLNKISNNPLYLIGKKILIDNKFYLILNFNLNNMIYLSIKYPLKNKDFVSLNLINGKIKFKIIKTIINIFDKSTD